MKIDIVGRGNVGTHMALALAEKSDVAVVLPRTLEGLRPDADLCIVCVSDNAVEVVVAGVARLVGDDTVIAHTSGSVPLSQIAGFHANSGVFYPFQTFTKGVGLDYEEIPMLIEGSNPYSEDVLVRVASTFSKKVEKADSEKRGKLHLAGVLSCNFANHLWTLSERYLGSAGIDFGLVKPLIRETCRKVENLSPALAQTGPAVRHDLNTIELQRARLAEYPEILRIYDFLTRSIMTESNNSKTQ